MDLPLPACESHPKAPMLLTLELNHISSGRLPDYISQDSLVFYQDIAVYPSFGGVVLAAEESRKIAQYLGDNKAIILQVCVRASDFPA
jgi:hypothetical protein